MRQWVVMMGMLAGLMHGGWLCAQAGQTPCDAPAGRWGREECETYRLERAEDTLTRLYHALLQGVGPAIAVEVQKGQSHWEELRRSHCELVVEGYGDGVGGNEGGTICRRKMTEERIHALRQLAEFYLDTED